MTNTVKDYVKNCQICKCSKAVNYSTRPPMGSLDLPLLPWQRISIDFLGPYPRSRNGYCFVMIILDHFSKFIILESLRVATSESSIQTLKKRVFTVFGVPEFLVSDNGKQFTSHKFQSFLSQYNVIHLLTPKYSPQANASERVNRTLLAAVRSYLGQDQRDWDLHLDEIACAIRSAFHEALGCSPYYALFGRNMLIDGKHYQMLRDLHCLGESDVDIIEPGTHFELIKNDIMCQLKLASERSAHRYNIRSNSRIFTVGQQVNVRNFVLSNAANKFSAKLEPKLMKATITERVGKVAFKCADEKGKSLGVYHLKDIR